MGGSPGGWGLGSSCDVGPGDFLMEDLPSLKSVETLDGEILVQDVVL